MPAKKSAAGRSAGTQPKVKQIGRYIVADPRICHGALTFRGTRILVSLVLEQVASGMPWDRIVEDWRGSIPKEAIAEAVQLAKESFLEHASEFAPPVHKQRKAS
jgi:uncharacterized protein (DUF433 family)